MRILFFFGCFQLLISCGSSQTDGGKDMNHTDRPNIVIIMADDLGYGDLGCYGNDNIRTPNLDSMASNGIRFTDFHSNGMVCSPTRSSILTGKYPQRTGITGVVTAKNHRNAGMRLEEITIADYLRELGYKTGMVGKWHLGYDTIFSPLNQGFDHFRGFVSGNIDYQTHYDQENHFDWWDGKQQFREEGYATDLITEQAVDFINQNREFPFFLYVAHAAPHYPYQGRNNPSFRGPAWNGHNVLGPMQEIEDTYKEMIEVMDEGVGKIIQALDELSLSNSTVIFFLSDNGANRHGSNYPYKGHKGQVWEGGHRVPGICYWGENIDPCEDDGLMLSMDIFPTIVDLTNRGNEKVNGLDGESFYTILQGEDSPNFNQRYVYWKSRDNAAVRKGPLKLVRVDGEYFLFNLDNDQQEVHNLMEILPDDFEELKLELEKWEAEVAKYPAIS